MRASKAGGAGSAHFVPRSLMCFTWGAWRGLKAVLLDPTIDVDASVASGFSQRDDERSGSGSHRKMDELREMLPALHRIAKQLTFSNGIPFIFFGHFILVLRFPSSREFQFEICFARSFLCFLNYTLQHHWIWVR